MMTFLDPLTAYADWGLLALRIAFGIIFIVHGLPKLTNAKGAAGGTGMPAWFMFVVGLLEALGGLAVLVGFLTQLGALGIALVMVGAIYMKVTKWKVPFSKAGTMGWEFDLVLLATALLFLTSGPGSLALASTL